MNRPPALRWRRAAALALAAVVLGGALLAAGLMRTPDAMHAPLPAAPASHEGAGAMAPPGTTDTVAPAALAAWRRGESSRAPPESPNPR